MRYEVRLSPSQHVVAIRSNPRLPKPWVSSNGMRLSDEDTSHWTPMRTTHSSDRVTCPWCLRNDRAVTHAGRIHRHSKFGSFPPQDCEGSGRFPMDFNADKAGAA